MGLNWLPNNALNGLESGKKILTGLKLIENWLGQIGPKWLNGARGARGAWLGGSGPWKKT